MHDPGQEAGGRQPVTAGLNAPDPETVALIDLDGTVLTSFRSFPDSVVWAERLHVETSLGFNIVALQIDEALADLLTAQDLIGALGRMGHG